MIACFAMAVAAATPDPSQPVPAEQKRRPSTRRLHKQKGQASVYSHQLAHRPTADGTPLDLNSDTAASKQLPLGSKAQVPNLRNGKSAVVQIKDLGPYVPGRIIDLSPHTAADLDFGTKAVQPVEVQPLEGN
jgi:rare lipoprotein A